MRQKIVTSEQMELGFAAVDRQRPAPAPQPRRVERAAWWFNQMRQAVDRALDWSASPAAPAEQVWLPGCRSGLRV